MSDDREKKIFIAAVPDSMMQQRENLAKELEQSGYSVMLQSDQEINSIPEILEQFDLAIHLLSDQDDIILLNNKGLQELQIQFTVQHYLSQKLISDSGEDPFKVYAWHPKSRSETIFSEEHLPPHLRKIQQLEEVELLRTNFEDFKYHLINQLKNDTPATLDNLYIKGDRNTSIYFIYDLIDSQVAEKYVDYLQKRGFTVYTPQFEGDVMAIRQFHTNCLRSFDKAIIFAKEVSVNWINMKIMDILKAPGLGRSKEISGKAIFIPEEKVRQCPMASRGFEFIPYREYFLEDELDSFVNNSSFNV